VLLPPPSSPHAPKPSTIKHNAERPFQVIPHAITAEQFLDREPRRYASAATCDLDARVLSAAQAHRRRAKTRLAISVILVGARLAAADSRSEH